MTEDSHLPISFEHNTTRIFSGDDIAPFGPVHHVTTIERVADGMGEDEEWLHDVANEMEIEDGVIWVYGVGKGRAP